MYVCVKEAESEIDGGEDRDGFGDRGGGGLYVRTREQERERSRRRAEAPGPAGRPSAPGRMCVCGGGDHERRGGVGGGRVGGPGRAVEDGGGEGGDGQQRRLQAPHQLLLRACEMFSFFRKHAIDPDETWNPRQ